MTNHSPEKTSGTSALRPSIARWAWPAGILAALVVLSLAMVSSPPSSAAPEKTSQPPAKPALPVETAQVMAAPTAREVTAVGTLQSNESVVITAEIAGRVAEIAFEEGEKVAGGKVLLRLDPSVLSAERDRARANLGLSEANYRRAEILLKDQAIAERERDEAYARWRLDEANLRLAEAQLAKTTIRAPFDGILGLRRVSVGGYLKPGDTIVTLDDLDPIKVEFRIPEIDFDHLRPGQAVDLMVGAAAGRTFSGKIYAVNPQIEANGRSVLVRARVANAEGLLRPGMFAHIILQFEKRATALMVPEQALIPQADGQLIYKVIDGQVEAVPVKTGIRRQGQVEIVEGLQAGDTVITAGQIKVRPGMQVIALPGEPQPENGG